MRPSESVWIGAVVLLGLVGLTAAPLRGQAVSVTPYVSAGPRSAAAGARLEVVGRWGGYARVAARLPGADCFDAFPGSSICSYPRGPMGEYALGALYSVPSRGGWGGRVGVGAGILTWGDGPDPFVDFAGEVRRILRDGLELTMGLHGLFAPAVERHPNAARTLGPRGHVVFPTVVLGLSFRLE